MGRSGDLLRVGAQLVLLAAGVALLVLLLGRPALSAELATNREVARALVAPAGHDGAVEARDVLGRDRRHSLGRLGFALVNTGLGITQAASPGSFLTAMRELVQTVRSWGERSPSERRALDLLEQERHHGAVEPQVEDLYRELRAREDRERLATRIERAEDALESGNTWFARREIARALAQAPGSRHAAQVQARIGAAVAQEGRDATDTDDADDGTDAGTLAPAEPDAARLRSLMRLLAGEHAAVEEAEPGATLVGATALYLRGEVDRARAAMEAVAEREGPDAPAGRLAAGWLSDPSLFPEIEFDRGRSRFHLRRTLRWLGGRELEQRGLDPSIRGYAAWSETLDPVNLAFSMPVRAFGGARPEAPELRAAAHRYLELRPTGDRTGEALDWLARTEPGAAERRLDAAWLDGRLRLPPPRTRYLRLAAAPIHLAPDLSRALDLEADAAPEEISSWLQAGVGLRLTASADAADVPEGAVALPAGQGTGLLARLRDAVELGTAVSDVSESAAGRAAALEGVYRLRAAIGRHSRVVVSPWGGAEEERNPLVSRFRSLLDAGSTEFASVRVRRGDDDLKLERMLLGASDECPADAVCLRRPRLVSAGFYASVDSGAGFRIGAHTRLRDASLSIELVELWPRASLVLPVARWLGLGGWLGFETKIGVSADGVTFSPVLSEPDDLAAGVFADVGY